MYKDLEKFRNLRKALEPLAVLYERTVLDARKEPFEVRLTIQQSADHLGENYSGENVVHIINGESLQAVYEIWLENRRIERQLLEKLDETTSGVSDEEQLPDELTYLSEPEREWLEWFYHLSDEDKKIVEDFGEKDISVTPDNFDQVKDELETQDIAAWASFVRLFKS